MDKDKKTVWLPFFGNNTSGDPRTDKIQMNPVDAYNQRESKQTIRTIMSAGTLIAVFALLLIGRQWTAKEKQNTSVGAMVNLKHAVRGVVAAVQYSDNSFTMNYQDSTDAEIIQAEITSWDIRLAPGADFNPAKSTLPICFSVVDVDKSLEDAVSVDCSKIVIAGKPLVVQYVTFNVEEHTMIVQKIYGVLN